MQKKQIARLSLHITFHIIQAIMAVLFPLNRQYFSAIGIAFISVLSLLYILWEKKKKFIVPDLVMAITFATILLNGLAGEYFNLYDTLPYFDKGLHIFGTFSFSLFIYSITEKLRGFKGSGRYIRTTYILFLGCFIGMCVELAEFSCDQIFKSNNQRDLLDTDLDMVGDLIGAIISAVFININYRYHKK